MVPQRSFFNPVRHKRTTFIVAIATTFVCAAIMLRGKGYVELAISVFDLTYDFVQQLF
jgi:hypothetical protein